MRRANTSDNSLISKVVRREGTRLEHSFREQMAGGTIESIIDEQVILPELSVRPGAVWTLPLPAGYLTSPGDAPGLTEEARMPKLTNREVGLTFDRMARS